MIHPDTEVRRVDDVVGVGVFATAFIPRGTITWALDPLDQVFAPGSLDGLGPSWEAWLDHHTYRDREARRILCWDAARAMNHSCEPTCGGSDLGFEVALVDIAPGEQLTNDYGTLHLEPNEGFVCRCGAPGCRGVVAPDGSAWERGLPLLREALTYLTVVPQPLAPLVAPAVLRAGRRAVGLPGTERRRRPSL
ncbi:MAG: SET domain-containing protein-lysine N-methyltransferase [Myxococcales bacterium]|nr:SET domain-containing protein-lysine N-methyltransferase [Myxococcales bacterium]